MDKHKKQILELLNDEDFVRWLMDSSGQDDDYWDEIVEGDNEKRELINRLKTIIQRISVKEGSLSAEDKLVLWEHIRGKTVYKKKTRHRRLLIRGASVAATLFILAASYYFFADHNRNDAINYYAIPSVDVKQQENIQLILPGNKTLQLEEDNAELVYDKQGKLNILGDTIEEEQEQASKIQLNQLLVPYGKTSSIILCDGTKVWINSGSRLIYPAVFNKKQREIFVDGEIYLEVAQNKSIPFVVKTNRLEVEVLGTIFNVQAYGEMNTESIVLAEGSVAVRSADRKEKVCLIPNQMYAYEKGTGAFDVRTVDIYDHICWKYGFLHFDSEKISTVLEKLARYYNVAINYDAEMIKDVLVTGKLDMKENLNDVLNSIALTAPIRFEVDGNKVNVKLKKH